MIRAEDLVAGFRIALDEKWGYIWGKTHEMWSTAKQADYIRDYGDDPDRAQSCAYGGKWAGHWVTDCSGLFAYWFAQLGGKMYHGSNTMFLKWCTSKGSLKNGKRTDGQVLKVGTAVFHYKKEKNNYSHVGLYVGGGLVIEAMGSKNGVTTSKATDKRWTHWGELKGISYSAKEDKGGRKMQGKVYAASGSTVNLRESASTSAKLVDKVPVGTEVEVVDATGPEWCKVVTGGLVGWMMRKFIQIIGEDDGGLSEPQPGDMVPIQLDYQQAANAYPLLKSLLDQIEQKVGRG